MSYSIDQLKVMDSAAISKCSPKHMESVIAELVQTAINAASEEREACAKVCEDRRGTVSMFGTSKECAAYNIAVYDCAAEIRARGNQ